MKFAYYTLISKDWFQGAVALVKSLKKTKTKHPIEVLVLNDVTEKQIEELNKLGANCTLVDRIGSRVSRQQSWHLIPEFYQNCFGKLNIWNADYDKLIYLDADTIVLNKLDHLFYWDVDFGAVCSTTSIVNPKTNESKSFLDTTNFNSGVLLIKPDKKLFEDMLLKKDMIVTEEGLDQGFLNEYFKEKWYRLPQIYNATRRLSMALPTFWNEIANDIYVLHYTLEKPWTTKVPGCEKIEKIWWQYFISE